MALSYVGAATGTNSATLPTFSVGDIAIVFAYRDGSTTAPTLPAGWTNIVNGGANTNSSRSGYRVLQSGDTTTGTWTNATSVVCLVHRANNGTAIVGASARGSGSSTTITYPAVTLQDTSGSSWGIRFAGHRSTNVSITTAPSGYTNRTSTVDATDSAAGFDSNAGITSQASGTAAVGGTASGFEAHTIELRFFPARDPLPYRDSLSGGDGTISVSSVSASSPTVVTGDLEVIWCTAGVFAPAAAPTIATPSGWNLGGTSSSLGLAGGALNGRAHLFWRIAPSSTGSSATLDAGTNAAIFYGRLTYSGPDSTSPFSQVTWGSDAGGDTSVVLSSLTVGENSLLSALVAQGAAQSITPPGSMTERVDDASYGVSVADETASATGATGTRTFTLPAAADALWGFAEFLGAETSAGISQSLAFTLDGISASVSQNLQRAQSLAATLDDVAAAIAQNLSHGQSLAATLDDITVNISQSKGASRSQSLAVTLDDVTAAVAQNLSHAQSLSATLDGITAAIAQNVAHPQNLAITLDDVSAAVAQNLSHSQVLSATLDDVTAAISQTVVGSNNQNIAFTLDGVSVAVAQNAQHAQALSVALDGISAAVSQNLSHSQALAVTLDSITVAIAQSAAPASKDQTLAITLDGVTVAIEQQGSFLPDTHDGFWAKEWERIRQWEKKKRIEEIRDEIEEIEEQIAEVQAVKPPKQSKKAAVFILEPDFYAQQARIVEQLIAAKQRLMDMEEEELLLLL